MAGGPGGFGAGERFGPFLIEGFVGSGGMAEVYRGVVVETGEVVALKLVRAGADEALSQRLLREAEIVADLRHPGVVPILASGELGGVVYLAMQLIDPYPYPRPDLRSVLEVEGPLPVRETLVFLGRIADALDAAHARGLVHRDVTPGNVLVERGAGDLVDAGVFLTDFGITRQAATRSTRTGGFAGTLHYAAPEQVRNELLDRRADVYSLACVAYEMLTGEAPFSGRDDVAAVVFAIIDAPPPAASARRPDVPRAVDDVLARALAKDRRQRPGTAGEFVSQFRHAVGAPDGSGGGVPVQPGTGPGARSGRSLVASVVGAVAALVVASATVTAFMREGSDPARTVECGGPRPQGVGWLCVAPGSGITDDTGGTRDTPSPAVSPPAVSSPRARASGLVPVSGHRWSDVRVASYGVGSRRLGSVRWWFSLSFDGRRAAVEQRAVVTSGPVIRVDFRVRVYQLPCDDCEGVFRDATRVIVPPAPRYAGDSSMPVFRPYLHGRRYAIVFQLHLRVLGHSNPSSEAGTFADGTLRSPLVECRGVDDGCAFAAG